MADRIQILLSQRWEDPLASEIPSWIAEASANFAFRERPAVVITPSREIGFYLKAAIMKQSSGFAGIHFWTPSQCRSFLLDRLPGSPTSISRANAELLLSGLACEFPDEPVIQSIAADPGRLLQAIETLLNATGDLSKLEGDSVRKLAGRFLELLKRTDLSLTVQVDHWLSQRKDAPVIGSLLLFGFSGSHWPLWPLLQAGANLSEDVTVCSLQPRHTASELDQTWINSWEEIAAETRSVDEARDVHELANVVEALESVSGPAIISQREPTPGSPVRYLVGRNLRDQIEAIIRQVLVDLSGPKCERVGVFFVPNSVVAREVAGRLESLEIPFFDGIGHHQMDDAQQDLWGAWAAFQEHPRMGELLALLRLISPDSFTNGLTYDRIESALNGAYQELLVDDLAALKSFLDQSNRSSWKQISEFITGLVILPREATLEGFLRAVENAMRLLDLGGYFRPVAERARELNSHLQTPIGIDEFLRWLQSIPLFERRARSETGNHPFAKVHLLSYEQAEAQGWSHLILADLNHHHWPPRLNDSPFLHEDTVSRINAENVATGRQGEGQQIVKTGKALCPGPNERRALHYRQWIDLIDSAKCSITATASIASETEPDRELVPSEYLTRLFHADRGETLSVEAFINLETQTAEWLEKPFRPHPQSLSPGRGKLEEKRREAGHQLSADVQQTAIAFTQRRDPSLPFAKYDFALETPPRDRQLNLAARDWESAFANPAILWLKHALGVEEQGNALDENLWPKTTGIWVHRWLQRMLNPENIREFFPVPSRDHWQPALRQAAEKTRTAAMKHFAEAGLKMPTWWVSGWERAFRLARQIAEQMQTGDEWKFAATEFTLPNPVEIPVSKNATLRVHGRLDLVLSDQAFDAEDSIGPSSRVWIIDYKTGSFSKLKLNDLKKHGKGIQLGLYALALKSLQAADVSASVAHPDEALVEQLGLDEIQGAFDLWKTLCRMQDSWMFGLRGNMQEEFGQSVTYPLATLPIDAETLEKKLKLTFDS